MRAMKRAPLQTSVGFTFQLLIPDDCIFVIRADEIASTKLPSQRHQSLQCDKSSFDIVLKKWSRRKNESLMFSRMKLWGRGRHTGQRSDPYCQARLDEML
jgi:hypothetical protein